MTNTLLGRIQGFTVSGLRLLRLLRIAGDPPLITLTALLVAGGLAPVANVYVTRRAVDRLVIAVAAGGDGSSVAPLLVWGALAAVLLLASQGLQGAIAWVKRVQAERLQDHISERIHEQSVKLDLAFYDSPKFFDRLHRARDEARYRPEVLVDTCSDLLQSVVTLAGMAAVLLAWGPALPFALLLGALPILSVVTHHGLAEQKWRRESTGDERRAWYCDSVLTSTDNAAELRLFDLGGYFGAACSALRATLRSQGLRLARRRAIAEALAGFGGAAVTGAAFGWMVWRAVTGAATLGHLAAFYQAFSQGLTTMRSLLSGVGRLYANSLFLEHLFEFLELQPAITDPARPVVASPHIVRGIDFRNVTFNYPNTERTALAGFNLHVPAGQTVAIVGANGAGKSTLIKLLCRLYDPIDGSIEIDGVNVRDFKLDDLRKMVTVLFQEPVRYCRSVGDNIALGNLPGEPSGGRIRAAGEAAGVAEFVESLPEGYSTLLGKSFDNGTELSAGEWQRIALARAFVRPSPILILDEPTSALDPWAEADWFGRFRQIARGRTSIIITHRLTTAMQADAIHLMDNGAIVESGSHHELLAAGGSYASSWDQQEKHGPRQHSREVTVPAKPRYLAGSAN